MNDEIYDHQQQPCNVRAEPGNSSVECLDGLGKRCLMMYFTLEYQEIGFTWFHVLTQLARHDQFNILSNKINVQNSWFRGKFVHVSFFSNFQLEKNARVLPFLSEHDTILYG